MRSCLVTVLRYCLNILVLGLGSHLHQGRPSRAKWENCLISARDIGSFSHKVTQHSSLLKRDLEQSL